MEELDNTWLVHNGKYFQGMQGIFIDEQVANTLCDDLNSSSNENVIYYVDKLPLDLAQIVGIEEFKEML